MTTMPSELDKRVMAYAVVELNPWPTIGKFYGLLALGACLTLLVCPQFGVGLGEHFLGHLGGSYGPTVCSVLCGAYCGGVYMGTGALLAVVGLGRAERRWVFRRHVWLALPAVVLSFVLLMAIGRLHGGSVLHEGWIFSLSWNATALTICALMLFVGGKVGGLAWHH